MIQRQFDPTSLMTERAEIEQAVAEFYAYEDELIARRRPAPGDDLISALIEAEEAGDRLSDDELRNLVLNILVGGVDTSQSQLAHAIRLLAEHPDQWELLRADPRGLASAAVEEALRFEPITPFTARILVDEVEHRGVTFPAGSIVLVSAWHANREGVEPDRFDLTAERGGARLLTFGAGIHYCVGANLARAEMQEGLAFLAERVTALALDGEPEFGTPSGIYGLETLPLKLELALATKGAVDVVLRDDHLGAVGRRRAADPEPPRFAERVDARSSGTSCARSSRATPRRLGARGADHRRRPGLLLGRRPEGRLRARRRRHARHPQGAARRLSPGDRRRPAAREAGGRGGQRPRGRDRLLAGAGLRPDHGRRVGLLRTGVRQHRADARRRLDRVRAAGGRAGAGVPDGAARRADPGAAGARVGPGQLGLSRRPADGRGRARSCERLAAGPTRSYAGSKRALNQFIYGDLDAQLDLEAELQHALGRTKDFFEGTAAFVEKRAPAFTGG